jgi:exonuclease III
MYRPSKPSKSKKHKVRAVARTLSSLRQGKAKSDTKSTRWRQTTLIETTDDCDHSILLPIEASGDSLIDKEDGCIRIALQNPNGIRLTSANMLPIVEAIHRLDIDMIAIPETKLSENGLTREVLQRQLNMFIGSSFVVEASAPKIKEGRSDYQPGGVMATLTGKVTGRSMSTYRDPMGRFVYFKLQGSRGEGIIFICTYRVSQKRGTKAGPTMAFTQQIGAILREELEDAERLAAEGRSIPVSNRRALDPRARLIADLKTLIIKERENGFCPILCMDANEDWSDPKTGKELKQFMLETSLVDPLYDRFHEDGLTHSTYSRGKQRIDFILFDPALESAVKRIGTLGLHEAIISDHVMIYADIDENELFQGLINRPVRVPSREFILSQADKCKKFIDEFRSIATKQNFDSRAKLLYLRFQTEGPSIELERLYNILDKEIQDQLLHVAKTIVRKKYG